MAPFHGEQCGVSTDFSAGKGWGVYHDSPAVNVNFFQRRAAVEGITVECQRKMLAFHRFLEEHSFQRGVVFERGVDTPGTHMVIVAEIYLLQQRAVAKHVFADLEYGCVGYIKTFKVWHIREATIP